MSSAVQSGSKKNIGFVYTGTLYNVLVDFSAAPGYGDPQMGTAAAPVNHPPATQQQPPRSPQPQRPPPAQHAQPGVSMFLTGVFTKPWR
jgi:hypothetical protein